MNWKRSLGAYAREYRNTFLLGAVLAAIAHMYFFTNTLPNYDTLVAQYSFNMGLSLGRWTNSLGSILSSAYALPWVTGVVCFALLGGLCAVTADVLEIRTKAGRAALCALLVTFPTLAASFSFLFIADSCAMGILLAALAVKLVKDTRFGILTGGVLLGISIGFYQAHISFAMLLCVVLFALQLLENRFDTPRAALLQAAKYAALIAVGFLLYYVGFRLCLLVTGYQLPNSYQDIQALTTGVSVDLAASGKRMWAEFSGCIGGGIPFLRALRVPLWIAFALMALCGAGSLIVRNRVYRRPLSVALLLLLLPAVPLSLTAVSLVSAQVGYHAVMRTAWAVMFAGAVAVMERACAAPEPVKLDAARPRHAAVYRALALIAAFVTAWNFWIVSNLGYLNMQQRYEKDYATMVRVADRLEQADGFTTTSPLLCTGYAAPYSNSGIFAHEQTALDALAGMSGDTMLVYPHVYNEFLSHYLGMTLPYPDDDTRAAILASDAFAAMNDWPAADSVREIDGVFVVRMGLAD